MDDHLILMDERRIHRSVRRMGHEIIETNKKDTPILLFGIDQSGTAVAELLGNVLDDIWQGVIETVSLPLDEGNTQKTLNSLPSNKTEDMFLIAVDDVIFSGETMFRALTKIGKDLPLTEIHTAVLIDRGHRKFPIRAGFYGMQLPTKLDEHVSVMVDDHTVKEVLLQNR
ncbi:pyrimidine operon attenuation protein / uracil phosphoribosyltransferase [Fodinibius salinus]|uniref:Pyrimidine operon attenuation protein / uracil phosphoribosyltransferase n=1 Tax=Fodinibius salinus TaxID=860790 RepID=A0A5D3YGZ7_9BACT|nr:phosphoribosyltransferase family protein [Fodinibius salinus]TYP91694.1 pyrimidine operon attenuation protein / uracil phosphoribosyltransferase [Fodinibius salinus]